MTDADVELRARALAHDLNNLFTEMLGHASLLEADSALPASARESAAAIRKAAERATTLTAHMIHSGSPGAASADLHDVVSEVAALAGPNLPANVRLSTGLSARRHLVPGPPGPLHDLLLNLVLNARDAMPAGGELRLSTSDAGSSVVLTVTDTGHGIDPLVRHNVFDPFFTTRHALGNSGLGLAIVRRIAEDRGGTVEIDSEPGRGTSVRVLLPLQPC